MVSKTADSIDPVLRGPFPASCLTNPFLQGHQHNGAVFQENKKITDRFIRDIFRVSSRHHCSLKGNKKPESCVPEIGG